MCSLIFGPSVQLYEERKAIVRKVRRDEDLALSKVRAVRMDLMPDLRPVAFGANDGPSAEDERFHCFSHWRWHFLVVDDAAEISAFA